MKSRQWSNKNPWSRLIMEAKIQMPTISKVRGRSTRHQANLRSKINLTKINFTREVRTTYKRRIRSRRGRFQSSMSTLRNSPIIKATQWVRSSSSPWMSLTRLSWSLSSSWVGRRTLQVTHSRNYPTQRTTTSTRSVNWCTLSINNRAMMKI